MDPISAGLLVALASGAAGEAGRQLWVALNGLVRRRPPEADSGSPEADSGSPEAAVGEAEVASLADAPRDVARAQALSEALGRRAAQDPSFRASVAQWHQQAQALRTGDGDVSNTISGGTQHGPVLQGRDFSGINFNTPVGDDTR
jgi:hypothetical protein